MGYIYITTPMRGSITMGAKQSTNIPAQQTMYSILFAISFVHLLNDTVQAVVPAIFPILKETMQLSNLQLGIIAFSLNITSSLMQPVIGLYSDRKPKPYLLPIGMAFTFFGMLGLSLAPSYLFILISVILVGIASATFHPEGSKVAYMAAGSRRGLAQSIYQVGGNAGQSLAPLLTILVFVPFGQFGAIFFTLVALVAIVVLTQIAKWYNNQLNKLNRPQKTSSINTGFSQKSKQIKFAIAILILLVFARSWYGAAITNFYPIYLIEEFGISIPQSQIFIFIFSAAGVIGTFFGGPLADRFGKRNMIFFSMLGSAPFALLLPHLSTFWTYIVLFIIGIIILSSFSVTVVYAQELLPGKIGLVSGLIVGLAFGMGAIGSVAIGGLADLMGMKTVMFLAGFLPLLGLFTFLLPSDRTILLWERE